MVLRVTRVGAQVAGESTGGVLRVTRVAAQVAGQSTGGVLRVTRVAAQVAGNTGTTTTAQVSTLNAQIATTSTTLPRILQSELGIGLSGLVGTTMGLGIPPQFSPGVVKALTADNSIAMSQSASDSGTANFDYTSAIGSPDSVLGESMVTGQAELNEYTAELGTEESGKYTINVGLLGASGLSPVVALTSIPGIELSVPGRSMTFAQNADTEENAIIVTASGTLVFVQTNAREKLKPGSATHTITFTQTNARTGTFSQTAQNTLVLLQNDAVAGPVIRTGSNTLSLTQTAESGLYTRTAWSKFTPSQLATYGQVIELTASDTFAPTQSVSPGLFTRTGHSVFDLIQSSNRVPQVFNAISLTASNTLALTQTNNRFVVFASATALTGSSTLTFTQRAIFPIFVTAENTIVFDGTSSGIPGKSVTQVLELVQTIVINRYQSLTASSTFNVQHAFTWLQFRDGVPIVGLGGCDVTKQYAPFSGGGNPPIRPVEPNLVVKNDVQFWYPSGASCAASDTVTLRTPNFGDRDRTQYNRINRESRGGSLQIYRDPIWPKQKVLVMDFSGIKDDEVDLLISFLETTLGQLVSFRDWMGRVWEGIIVTPDAAVTRQGHNRNDIALEMEVNESFLELVACNNLNLTQTNAVVKVTP